MKATSTVDLKRAVVIRKPWATIRRWRTRDGQHAVECSHIEYGHADESYSDAFRVLARDQYGWLIVSRHRK